MFSFQSLLAKGTRLAGCGYQMLIVYSWTLIFLHGFAFFFLSFLCFFSCLFFFSTWPQRKRAYYGKYPKTTAEQIPPREVETFDSIASRSTMLATSRWRRLGPATRVYLWLAHIRACLVRDRRNIKSNAQRCATYQAYFTCFYHRKTYPSASSEIETLVTDIDSPSARIWWASL